MSKNILTFAFVNFNALVDEFCQKNNLDVDKLMSAYRGRTYADARRILYAKLKEEGFTFCQIAHLFNRNSHSTIISALSKHEWLVKHDKEYRGKVL